MKKIILMLIIVMILLVGCGDTDSTSKILTATKNQSGVGAQNELGYVFESKGVIIAMNAEAAPILKSLGTEKGYFEAPSCAFQGLDKTYTYNGFELQTYEMNKVDYISAVRFVDDSISTKEGIYLYSNLDKVFAAYGDKYTQNFGLYTYELDKSKLAILTENNKVVSIEYIAITE